MALPTASKLYIKYGLHLLLFFTLNFGIFWMYQYPKNNCIHSSVLHSRQQRLVKESKVQTNIHLQQNENTGVKPQTSNTSSPGESCGGGVDFKGSYCPPGYQRRLTDVVFMMDQKTGSESVKFLLEHHTQLTMGYESRYEYLSREAANQRKLTKPPEVYCDYMPCVLIDSPIRVVDISASYLRSQTAPLSASNIRPEMKIIVVVRDPVEQLLIYLSHQLYTQRRSKIPRGQPIIIPPSDWHSIRPLVFKGREALPETLIANFAVNSSKYHNYLKNWLPYFPFNDKLLVVNFNDIQRNPFEELHRIESFLGLDHEVTPDTVIHRQDDCFCRISPFKNHLGDCMTKDCKNLIVDVPDDVRTLLKDYYKEPNKILYAMTGKDYGWDV